MPPQIEVLRTLEEKVTPRWTALLVIDMQNDFCDPQGASAREGGRDTAPARAIIPTIRRLADGLRTAGGLVVWVKFTTLPDGASHSGPWIDARSRATYGALTLGLEGSWGQELAPGLEPQPGDVEVKKYRYSAFTATHLDLILRGHGIKTIVVSGVSTNACVESTIRAGFELDYYVVVPEDACASWSQELHEATLANVRHRFGVVTTADQLLALWGSVPATAAP
ncbi:MAG: cysteine hydrolase [Chloroflexi bacterium]|nr:cysteine hydrolase [Chloroflexota bacterium]GIW09345.1 MAG: isochorismatase [Dehalococcoidia bacterium]